MDKLFRYFLQAVNYAIFMALVWYLSFQPAYHQLEKDQAVITLSFSHATKIREPCRQLSQEELMKLAPNMRLSMDCPRERSPLSIELYLDDSLVTESTFEPPGFRKDQVVTMYRSIKVKAGEHILRLAMNDDVKVAGPTYFHEEKVKLEPEQMLLIDFDAGSGGFFIK